MMCKRISENAHRQHSKSRTASLLAEEEGSQGQGGEEEVVVSSQQEHEGEQQVRCQLGNHPLKLHTTNSSAINHTISVMEQVGNGHNKY